MPCLWCATEPGSGPLYRHTKQGKELMDIMEQLGCEVPA